MRRAVAAVALGTALAGVALSSRGAAPPPPDEAEAAAAVPAPAPPLRQGERAEPPARRALAQPQTEGEEAAPACPPARASALHGTLLDPYGRGAAGSVAVIAAGVIPSLRGETRTVATEKGPFALDVPLGRYRVVGVAGGFDHSDVVTVDLTAQRPRAQLELRLRLCGEVRGTVVDEDGAPVTTGRLRLLATDLDEAIPYASGVSDAVTPCADGGFRFACVSQSSAHRLVYVPPSDRGTRVEIDGVRAGDGAVRVVVTRSAVRTGTLTGVVRGPDGAPLRSYEIMLDGATDWQHVDGAEGRFVIEGVPWGRECAVLVRARDLTERVSMRPAAAAVTSQSLSEVAGTCRLARAQEHLELRLLPPGDLQVLVRDATGSLVPSAMVRITPAAGAAAGMLVLATGADGWASVFGLSRGRYTISVIHPRHAETTATVEPGRSAFVELCVRGEGK